MKKWSTSQKLPYAEGETFEAILRHYNPKVMPKDQLAYLTIDSGGLWYLDTKLSYEWSIVMHRPIKQGKK